jgi:hypothetical protein
MQKTLQGLGCHMDAIWGETRDVGLPTRPETMESAHRGQVTTTGKQPSTNMYLMVSNEICMSKRSPRSQISVCPAMCKSHFPRIGSSPIVKAHIAATTVFRTPGVVSERTTSRNRI